jgi:hypothetical protein
MMWGILNNYEAFWINFQRNEALVKKCEAFKRITRPFKHNFRKIKAFDYKCEAFIKLTRFFKAFSENQGFCLEMWAFVKKWRLVQRFWYFLKKFSMDLKFLKSDVRLFEKIRCHLIKKNWGFFQ